MRSATVAPEATDPRGNAEHVFGDSQAPRVGIPVQVHDSRIDSRSRPVGLTPSQAVHLAQHGPPRSGDAAGTG